MVWVLVFSLIALGGLVMVVSYAVWLWHKATDLFSELEMLGTRADELGTLLGQLQLDPATERPTAVSRRSS
jgi:cell division protein FtsL